MKVIGMRKEKAKSILLVFLIALSIVLTYHLWFGKPPLEEGAIPRYERMYFNPPPPYEEVIKPSQAVVYSENGPLVFRQGDRQTEELWEKLLSVHRSIMEDNTMPEAIPLNERPSGEFEEELRLIFDPPVSLNLIASQETGLQRNLESATTVKEAVLMRENDTLYLSIEGEEFFWVEVPAGKKEELTEMLEALEGLRHQRLSGTFYFSLHEEECDFYEDPALEDSLLDETEEEDGEDPGENTPNEERDDAAPDSTEEELEARRVFEVEVPEKLYVPVEDLWAAPVALNKKTIDEQQLVRAFFYDLSMARQIEEHDGAQYFTDGEKGLRICPFGLMEYAAPRLEQTSSEITYRAALQQAIENVGLYGGWQQNLHLVEMERQGRAFKLGWRLFYRGLPLIGEGGGDEMILNEQGVTFYRRHFHDLGEEVSDQQLFRSYEEALCRVMLEFSEELGNNEATLHALRPVYYIGEERRFESAVPAWEVKIGEVGTVFLHWSSLERLN